MSKLDLDLWRTFFVAVLGNSFNQGLGFIYTGCSLGTDRVISYDNSLIHPLNITASSQGSTFNRVDELFNRNNSPLRLWCTEELHSNTSSGVTFAELLEQGGSSNVTIQVIFTRPLLLTHLISSGHVNGFVKSFTLQTSLDLEGQFLKYISPEGASTFEVRHIDTAFPLTPPIAARKIRFDILDGVLSPGRQLCWHLTLLGCLLNEANLLQEDSADSTQITPLPQCSRGGIVSTSSSPSQSTSSSCPVMTVTQTVPMVATVPMLATVPMPTTSLNNAHQHEIVPTSLTSFDSFVAASTQDQKPSSCPVTLTQTVEVVSSPCTTSFSGATNYTNNMTAGGNQSSQWCHRCRLILYVVPSVAVGLLILACLGFVCVSACIHCRCNRSKSKSCSKGEAGIMTDNVLYESRDQDCHIPKRDDDTLGMIDNEIYKTRSSMMPSSVLAPKHSPGLDHSTSFNGVPRRTGYHNRSENAVYENRQRLYPANKRSTFIDSMNNRSTVTTDLEQSIRSVDSMVDNPTYSVPFPQPVDYHAVSIYPPQRNSPKLAYSIPTHSSPMNFLSKGVSAIDMVDNESYSVPSSSLTGQDEMEHSLMARQHFQPMEYETPK